MSLNNGYAIFVSTLYFTKRNCKKKCNEDFKLAEGARCREKEGKL
jgi:hypothetical protein